MLQTFQPTERTFNKLPQLKLMMTVNKGGWQSREGDIIENEVLHVPWYGSFHNHLRIHVVDGVLCSWAAKASRQKLTDDGEIIVDGSYV